MNQKSQFDDKFQQELFHEKLKNLSDEQKMEKYKQVYHILQKFIHDEYEQNSIFSKNKEPLN